MAPILLVTSCLLLAGSPEAKAAAGPALPTVSIDLAPLDRSTFEELERAGIYQGLVVRLVTERVALVDPKERADIVLRMQPGGAPRELLVTATSGADSRNRRVSIRDLDQEDVRLQLIHGSVELVRQVLALRRSAPLPAASRPRERLELDGGALWSAGKPGVLARLAGGVPLGPGEVELGLALHRPLSLPSGLDVTEWGLLAGYGTGERAVGSRGLLSAGLDLGLWQHRWSWSGTGAESGSPLDAAALLHGQASLRLGTSWRVGVDGGALWTSHERVHRTSSERLWKAPRVRPFAGLSVGFELGAGN